LAISDEKRFIKLGQKFEEDLANSIIAEIKEEVPPDWTKDSSSKV
jgi:hypothetical protein